MWSRYDALYVFARGIDGTTHHWSHDPTWRWDAIGGAYTTSPDVYHFGDQVQTFGRNTDGHLQSIWYDAEAGIWNVERHGVPID